MTYPTNTIAQLDWRQLETMARDTDNALALRILELRGQENDERSDTEREAFDAGFAAGYKTGAQAAFEEAKRVIEREAADLADDFDAESRAEGECTDDAWLQFEG